MALFLRIVGEKVPILRQKKWSKWYADAFKRCAAQFAVEWSPREFLGRPGARYSAVFVFYLENRIESHGDALKRCAVQFAFQCTD